MALLEVRHLQVNFDTPEGEVHIADPAFGNRTLSRKRFEDAWVDGITFVMLRGTE